MRTKEDCVAILIVTWIMALIVCGVGHCESAYSETAVKTIAMESANQSDYGMYAVSSVIVNRSVDSNKTIKSVCLARKQFSCWNDKIWAKAWLDRFYTPEVRGRSVLALNKALQDPIRGINHYHSVKVKPYWAKGRKPSLIIGEHVFYKL